MVLILLLARPSQDSNLSSLRPSMNSMLLLDKLRIFKWFNLQTWDIRTNSLLQADNWMGVERKTQLNEEKKDWKGLGIPIIKPYTYWAILKVSLESKLSVNESKLFPWSSRICLVKPTQSKSLHQMLCGSHIEIWNLETCMKNETKNFRCFSFQSF